MRPERESDPQLASAQRVAEARRLRERFAWLNNFTDVELEQICFCETGAEMVPGETYFDISHPENGPFVAQTGQIVLKGGCLVRRREVAETIWQKLISYPPRR